MCGYIDLFTQNHKLNANDNPQSGFQSDVLQSFLKYRPRGTELYGCFLEIHVRLSYMCLSFVPVLYSSTEARKGQFHGCCLEPD